MDTVAVYAWAQSYFAARLLDRAPAPGLAGEAVLKLQRGGTHAPEQVAAVCAGLLTDHVKTLRDRRAVAWSIACLATDRAHGVSWNLSAEAPALTMDATSRQIAELYYSAGLSVDAIAARLCRSEAVIRSALQSARVQAAAAQEPRSAAVSLPVVARSSGRRIASVGIGSVAALLVVVLMLANGEPGSPPAPAAVVVPSASVEATAPPAAPAAVVPPPVGETLAPTAAATIVEAPHPSVEPLFAPLPLLPPLVVVGNAGEVRALNDAQGEFKVEGLNDGKKLILTGKIKRLVIGQVNGQSVLDASGLEAEEIVVLDKIDGRSTVRLHAPRGSVEFHGKIDGQSTVQVIAPQGKVTFMRNSAPGREDSKIDGESQVTIAARDVDFRGAVNGTHTRVLVALSNMGRLKFQRLAGAVKLHYRTEQPEDAEPLLERGDVVAQAELKRVD